MAAYYCPGSYYIWQVGFYKRLLGPSNWNDWVAKRQLLILPLTHVLYDECLSPTPAYSFIHLIISKSPQGQHANIIYN